MDARSLTLTLLLTFLSPLSASPSPSPSPSLSPGPSLSPPKQLTGDPAGISLSPPENLFAHHLPSPPPPHHLRPSSCPACHHQVDADDRKLNFGQMMGIVLGGVAVALQVALGGFLVYKRLQLRKVERRGRTRLASSSTSSTA